MWCCLSPPVHWVNEMTSVWVANVLTLLYSLTIIFVWICFYFDLDILVLADYLKFCWILRANNFLWKLSKLYNDLRSDCLSYNSLHRAASSSVCWVTTFSILSVLRRWAWTAIFLKDSLCIWWLVMYVVFVHQFSFNCLLLVGKIAIYSKHWLALSCTAVERLLRLVETSVWFSMVCEKFALS